MGREEKVRQIAEKRRQVEELKRRRQERENRALMGNDKARSVDSLVAEILGNEAAGGGKSAEKPLQELAQARSAAAAAGRPGERSIHFQQELHVAREMVEPQEANVYDRSVQTDLSGQDLNPEAVAAKANIKQPTSVLMKMAERAKAARAGPAGRTAQQAKSQAGPQEKA